MASAPKKKAVGSLADKSLVEQMKKDRDDRSAALNQATKSGDMIEVNDLKSINNPQEKAILAEFERRKKARQLTLPTEDIHVKLMLRKLNKPICLFGEDILDRRERLRRILSTLDEDEVTRVLHSIETKESQRPTDIPAHKTTWYHEGPPELRSARVYIADYSLPKAKARLDVAKERAKKPYQEKALKKQELHKFIHSIEPYGSQVVGLRAASFCEFSPDNKHMITSAWCGQVALWSIPDLKKEMQLIGHQNQVGCARFHPMAYKDGNTSLLTAASSDFEGKVYLWSADQDKPIAQLEDHKTRVSRLAFHPSGRFIATACHDASWRLHDIVANKEVLFQEGHSKAVFDIEFQDDGSLCLSGGYDCYGRVWDLRTGKCIMFLEGHQQSIHTIGWHPNGFYMATGSADNSCKIWDLRMRRDIYGLPAHKNLVSRLKIDKEGEYMVTGSFDKQLKIWTPDGWQALKHLDAHELDIMCVDVSNDSQWIASCSKDKTVKLWAPSSVLAEIEN